MVQSFEKAGWAIAWLFLVFWSPAAGAAGAEVDVELVFAVDASGSVNENEFRLQLGGIAAALRDPSIHQAIVSGPRRKVAVALLVWADSAFPKYASSWYILSTPRSANAFADLVETFHEKTERKAGIGGGGTGIGDAVAFAMNMMAKNDIEAIEQVVDVSGDGIETPPWFGEAVMLPQARALADSLGITVNGLAILTDFWFLERYYRENVIVGEGSFVIAARDFEDFRRAMREKMWREFVKATAGLDRPTRFAAPVTAPAGAATAVASVSHPALRTPSPGNGAQHAHSTP